MAEARQAAHAAVREQVLERFHTNAVGRDVIQWAVNVALDTYEDALFTPVSDQGRRGWAVMLEHRPLCVVPTRRLAKRQRKALAPTVGRWVWQLRIEPTEVFDPIAMHCYEPVPVPRRRPTPADRNQDAQSAAW